MKTRTLAIRLPRMTTRVPRRTQRRSGFRSETPAVPASGGGGEGGGAGTLPSGSTGGSGGVGGTGGGPGGHVRSVSAESLSSTVGRRLSATTVAVFVKSVVMQSAPGAGVVFVQR